MLGHVHGCHLPDQADLGDRGVDHSASGRKDTMEHGFAPSEIDTSRPHPARMYDYYFGGKDDYVVDREAARQALLGAPELRVTARGNQAFLASIHRVNSCDAFPASCG
jgi:hypothetical protein